MLASAMLASAMRPERTRAKVGDRIDVLLFPRV